MSNECNNGITAKIAKAEAGVDSARRNIENIYGMLDGLNTRVHGLSKETGELRTQFNLEIKGMKEEFNRITSAFGNLSKEVQGSRDEVRNNQNELIVTIAELRAESEERGKGEENKRKFLLTIIAALGAVVAAGVGAMAKGFIG